MGETENSRGKRERERGRERDLGQRVGGEGLLTCLQFELYTETQSPGDL